MKHNPILHSPARQPLYPGAADTNYFTEKALEILAAILTGTGAVTAMLFLVIMA